jgi:hypothetical protein
LLLGLKGILSELELHTMRARLNRGSLNKAQRGELFLHTPIGYVRLPSGGVDFDPDEQVRAVVRLIFDKFEELGSATAVFRYLARHGIRIGVRPSWGPNRGQVEWRRPCRTTILNLLRNPIYAGAYVFGRRHANPQKNSYRRHRVNRPSLKMEDWKVLLQDRLPAYITWERHLAIVEHIGQNRARWETLGAPRKGPALLGGLIHCGQCGGRLTIHYGTQVGRGWYDCHRRAYDPEAAPCPHVPADIVDGVVSQQVLLALEPAALELSVQASQDIQHERDRMRRLWEQRLERARYEAERAQRQYNAVEPENRLVARTLERRWEEALDQERKLQEEHDRFLLQASSQLSADERKRIAELAADIPALWEASTTTAADRQTIIRHLVQRVVTTVPDAKDFVTVAIHWVGGHITQHQVRRRVHRLEHLSQYDALRGRIGELRQAGWTGAKIAEQLNQEGFHLSRSHAPFKAINVHSLLRRFGLNTYSGHYQTNKVKGNPHEWCLPELARKLRITLSRMQCWRQRGWVHSRRIPGAANHWFVWADKEELTRLRRLRDCPIDRSHKFGDRYPKELTTPKPRTDA